MPSIFHEIKLVLDYLQSKQLTAVYLTNYILFKANLQNREKQFISYGDLKK